jgi:CDP-paratose 2-epimerase
MIGGAGPSPERALRIVRPQELDGPVLITGGAGFVGSNLADRLLARGVPVIVLDNLQRSGVAENLSWLRRRHARGLHVEVADVRDARAVAACVAEVSVVYHLAAQVAVTTSLLDPMLDFEVNVRGTLNVLEAMRRRRRPPRLIFASTNKVYGSLLDVPLLKQARRYEPADPTLRACGIGEDRPLDFHSPYGCSKGAADQYVLDYGRTYGLETVVLRMSCIYGARQRGTEDQGWVAHFLIRALQDAPITCYGDGMQVRDVLHIDDLLAAFDAAYAVCDFISGSAFNIGGGPAHAVSLLDVVDMIAGLRGERPDVRFERSRPGDQRYYVSDHRRFTEATGWRPRLAPVAGIAQLYRWLIEESEVRAFAPEIAQEMV